MKGLVFQEIVPNHDPFELTTTIWFILTGSAISIQHIKINLGNEYFDRIANSENITDKSKIVERIKFLMYSKPKKYE